MGAFDFAESDAFITKMGSDQPNVAFDQARKRWLYSGHVVALQSDIVDKKWWQFWK